MIKKDIRKLSIRRQEVIRFQVLDALDKGMRKKDAISKFGVSDAVIYKWLAIRSRQKDDWPKQEKRGRPARIKLTNEQEEQVKKTLINNFPDDLNLPFSLWTRAALRELLREKFKTDVSLWTIGRYFQSWSLTPPMPIYKTKEKKSPETIRWLRKEYPVIKTKATKECAEIHWGGQMGMRSHRLANTIKSKKGDTPAIISTLKRFSLNMIYSIDNRGKFQFMFVRNEITTADWDHFMLRLVKYKRRNAFLIVEHDQTHNERTTKAWNNQTSNQVNLILLPSSRLWPNHFE